MLKFHKESDFHLPQSQNCLRGSNTSDHPYQHECVCSITLINMNIAVVSSHIAFAHLNAKTELDLTNYFSWFFSSIWKHRCEPIVSDAPPGGCFYWWYGVGETPRTRASWWKTCVSWESRGDHSSNHSGSYDANSTYAPINSPVALGKLRVWATPGRQHLLGDHCSNLSKYW